MGIKYKLKLKDLKLEYFKEYFSPFLKYFKKIKKINNYSDLKEFIQKKVIAVLNAGLNPILCIGEELIERSSGKTKLLLMIFLIYQKSKPANFI